MGPTFDDAGRPTLTEGDSAERQTLTHDARPPAGAAQEHFARGDAIGRYVVLEELGRGGMGVVYAAYDPQLDRRVAIKLLRPRRLTGGEERLLREAQALARLDDAHVLKVYDVGTFGGRVFLAMEYVAGRSLAAWLRDEPRGRAEILDAYLQAGRGLAAAHEAELIHRDFKPSNAMVRQDGRVVVLDFGLARSLEPAAGDVGKGVGREEQVREALVVSIDELDRDESPSGERQTPSPLARGLTEAGALLGTPAYMAPEQWAGQPATAASDQFSFCVSLYSALYGEAPFDRARGGPPITADVRPATDASDVPAWLRRVLLRGLAEAPEDRYPSMAELLRALEADPAAKRRRLVRRGLGAAAVLALGVFAWPRADAVCAGSAERLGGVWDAPRRVKLATAFRAIDAPWAPATGSAVTSIFDHYGEAWAKVHRDVCEATHVRGEQSEALLDRRMACLDARRREFGALVDLLLDEPAEHLPSAVRAAAALSPLDACADVESLLAVVPPPSGEAARAQLAKARDGLAGVQALFDAGSYRRGREAVTGVLEEARAAGHAPLLAEALLLAGALQAASGEVDSARSELEESLWWASAGRHERAAAEAFVRLVRVAGYQGGDLDAAERFATLAGEVISRLGRPGELAPALADQLAVLALQQGQPDEARRFARQALEQKSELFGPDHPALARSLLRAGNIEEQAGDAAAARELFARALEIQRRHLGPEHPDVALNLDRLGAAERLLGDYDNALRHHREALGILQRTLGDHPSTAAALTHLGNALGAVGSTSEAAERQAEALAVYERTLGAEHAHSALARANLALALAEDGRLDEARRHYEETLEIQRRLHGEQHPWLATTRFNYAELLNELGEPARALDLHLEALEAWRQTYGDEHPLIDRGLVAVGRSLSGLGRCEQALLSLDSALARLEARQGAEPEVIAEAHFERARCLLETGRHAPALEAARRAEEMLEAAPSAGRLGKRIRDWLERAS